MTLKYKCNKIFKIFVIGLSEFILSDRFLFPKYNFVPNYLLGLSNWGKILFTLISSAKISILSILSWFSCIQSLQTQSYVSPPDILKALYTDGH